MRKQQLKNVTQAIAKAIQPLVQEAVDEDLKICQKQASDYDSGQVQSLERHKTMKGALQSFQDFLGDGLDYELLEELQQKALDIAFAAVFQASKERIKEIVKQSRETSRKWVKIVDEKNDGRLNGRVNHGRRGGRVRREPLYLSRKGGR